MTANEHNEAIRRTISPIRGATLAVGTELTDGQITDRNSAWISQKLVNAGVTVLEHRAVPDDTKEIKRALEALAARVDVLFVTGGLGPTSDDFTRNLLSSVFDKPLEFDQGSWDHIVERFRARNLEARPIQRQQCYFPRGSRVLKNPAGTANAFCFSAKDPTGTDHSLTVYALPGPPVEIAAIWEMHLAREIEALVPNEERDRLVLLRTLGRGESEIAEITEEAIQDSGMRVGYRAHLPYVEVKLWFKERDRQRLEATIARVESVLSPHLINRNDEDLADDFLAFVQGGMNLVVRDHATMGYFQDRVLERLRVLKLADSTQGSLVIENSLLGRPRALEASALTTNTGSSRVEVVFEVPPGAAFWRIHVKNATGRQDALDVQPTSLYNVGTDRGRRYFVERALQHLVRHLLTN